MLHELLTHFLANHATNTTLEPIEIRLVHKSVTSPKQTHVLKKKTTEDLQQFNVVKQKTPTHKLGAKIQTSIYNG